MRGKEVMCDPPVGPWLIGPFRGTSPIRKHPPPYDPRRLLGKFIREGPRGVRFLMSEVPLYGRSGLAV